jgi:uncharacterized protein (TIGR03067 family)
MNTHVLVVLAAGLLLAADAPDRGGPAHELKKFTGTWRAVAIERDGRKAPPAEVEKVRLTVTGDHYTLTVGDQTIKGTHKLDPSSSPKHIDAIRSEGEHKGQSIKGIYELDDNTFKVCFALPGQDRPTHFSTTDGGGHRLIIMKRQK